MDESRDSMIGRTELKIDSVRDDFQKTGTKYPAPQVMGSGCSLEEELPFDKVIPPMPCSG
jgi:hypothetical protein